MAKLAYSKLGIKSDIEIKNINFNEQIVEVKQYLPIASKLEMVENILNYSAEDKHFYNIGKIEIYLALEIISNYTNIGFTDKQKKDPAKLYDGVCTSGFYKVILETIPENEISLLKSMINETINSVYNFDNSILGILNTISQDYSNLNFDAEEIQAKLADPENLELLKSILTKLG